MIREIRENPRPVNPVIRVIRVPSNSVIRVIRVPQSC
jgi:hypothetical protein